MVYWLLRLTWSNVKLLYAFHWHKRCFSVSLSTITSPLPLYIMFTLTLSFFQAWGPWLIGWWYWGSHHILPVSFSWSAISCTFSAALCTHEQDLPLARLPYKFNLASWHHIWKLWGELSLVEGPLCHVLSPNLSLSAFPTSGLSPLIGVFPCVSFPVL